MLRKIFKCTLTKGNVSTLDQTLTMKKLETFIAVKYAYGIYGKNYSVYFPWLKFIVLELLVKQCLRTKEIRKFLHFNLKSIVLDQTI